ncbi:hypothetical protein EON81_29145, partial [bacterium]
MVHLVAALLIVPQQEIVTSLWSVGTVDGKPAEFGLAPGGYERYGTDAVFVVGLSKASDVPYVLPGPNDTWASNTGHRLDIAFGLTGKPTRARFALHLSDTHPSAPPRLTLSVNGKRLSDWQSPAGLGDDLVLGKSQVGRTSDWSVEIPAANLRPGNNTVTIGNESGSWAVLDAIRMETTGNARLQPVVPTVKIEPAPSRQAVLRTTDGPRQPVSV